jgi:hypothetical protein
VIERAKGVVMGTLGCDADAAFDHLRRASQQSNRPLRDVAEEVATTRRLPGATDPAATSNPGSPSPSAPCRSARS